MLRRFEIYSLDPAAPPAAVERLRVALRDSPRYIPEVRHSAVGDNLADSPVRLAWEHAYDSPEAYRRYMVHPYHAAILDRYLLADSPERVTSSNGLEVGLAGYAWADDRFALASGIRRLVFVDLRSAEELDVARVADRAASAPSEVPGLAVSVFAENSMAARWFDGESVTATAPRWSHIWEQGFADEAAYDAYAAAHGLREGEGAEVARMPGVAEVAVVRYRIETP